MSGASGAAGAADGMASASRTILAEIVSSFMTSPPSRRTPENHIMGSRNTPRISGIWGGVKRRREAPGGGVSLLGGDTRRLLRGQVLRAADLELGLSGLEYHHS